MLAVRESKFLFSRSWGHVSSHAIDRSVVRLPGVLIDTFHVDPGELLRPVLDALANAAGLEKSLAYDESGSLKSQR